MNILIIDDDELDRILVVRTFRDADINVNVTQAPSGQEGIDLAKAHNFDVVLLDYNLPDYNGLEVLDHLSTHSANDNAVIMLSGEEDIELAKKAISKGAHDFFVKSDIDVDRLIRAVSKATHLNKLKLKEKADRIKLQKLVELDPLTGLSNRYDFELSYNQAFARANRGAKLAILLLDVDKFKTVNDTLGHDAGDMLLKFFSSRLKEVVRDSDMVARLGGDEFVILMHDFNENEQAVLLADRIIHSFEKPIDLNGTDWRITTSIGIAVYDNTISTPDELLKNADIAMYRSKQNGRNQSHFYSKTMHIAVENKRKLKNDLHKAIANNELLVKLSPIIPANSNMPTHFTSAFYWQHRELGELDSSKFYDAALESGLLAEVYIEFVTLSLELFDELSSGTASFSNSGLYVASNDSKLFLPVCGNVLECQSTSEKMRALFIQNNLSNSITLIINESGLTTDLEAFTETIQPFVQDGTVFAINDFACNISKLSCFTSMPLEFVLVDRNKINSSVLLSAIIGFCKTLSCHVICKASQQSDILNTNTGFSYYQVNCSLQGDPIVNALDHCVNLQE